MRNVVATGALLAGALALLAESPPRLAHAQVKTLAKTEKIRELLDLTGAKNMGQELMKAGIEQLRTSVSESQPNNPRATQFVDAFVAQFAKHFKPEDLNEKVLPIYDKYLSEEDVSGLLEYYRSPLGQRMMKVLPEVAKESQALGFSLGQKAAQETLEDLRKDFPEFVPDTPDKSPGTGVKKE